MNIAIISLCIFSINAFFINAQRLRVVTIENAPFYSRRADGTSAGFLIDLLADLVERANGHNHGPDHQHTSIIDDNEISYEVYPVPDNKYGMLDERGEWNGIIGELVKGNADLAVAPLTITKARQAAVVFSHPFMSVVVVPLVKKPESGSPMPFHDLNDLYAKVNAGNLSIGFVEHGSTATFFSKHKMPQVSGMYNASKSPRSENPNVATYQQGIERTLQSNGRFVFFGEHIVFDHFIQQGRPCNRALIAWGGAVGTRYYGLAFARTPAGRQWASRFNEALLDAEEDGTIAALKDRWWDRKAVCEEPRLCMC